MFSTHATHSVTLHTHTHKPQDLTIALEVLGFWFWAEVQDSSHWNTGNDISYVLQDTEKERERRRRNRALRERERE